MAENSAKTKDVTNTSSNTFWWMLTAILVLAGIGANYYFSEVAWAIRLAGWIILACVIIIFVGQTAQGKMLWKFAKDSRIEMRKVVWPNRDETFKTTMVVIALVIVVALIMWGADSILLKLIGLLTIN